MRLEREAKTIRAMIDIFCQGRHGREEGHCEDCQTLLDYALVRVGKCRYGKNKPACAKCPTHCYKPEMRDRVREVMRYAGPRMLARHPYLALRHLGDSALSELRIKASGARKSLP